MVVSTLLTISCDTIDVDVWTSLLAMPGAGLQSLASALDISLFTSVSLDMSLGLGLVDKSWMACFVKNPR